MRQEKTVRKGAAEEGNSGKKVTSLLEGVKGEKGMKKRGGGGGGD